MTTWYYT